MLFRSVSGSSESDHLSFDIDVRNDVIRFLGRGWWQEHGHILHDIELLDEADMPHSASLFIPSN